jgi:prepilin-type N-terminal cleavage/methylation domain-containing protein
MKRSPKTQRGGFTLLETVIAIGVLAVLLTGFLAVFAPAAAGIRRSINVQEADRLTSALERELTTLRGPEVAQYTTGFNKAYDWIEKSNTGGEAILVYQYRGNPSSLRPDGTAEPVVTLTGLPGEAYILQPIARRISDAELQRDLDALEGGVFLVKCTQLVFNGGQLQPGTPGSIVSPDGAGAGGSAETYPEAVIAFAAEFHSMPSRSPAYFRGAAFQTRFAEFKNPVFTRNLAVRR